MNTPPSFGQVVRGLRFGYNWSRKHGCFVRIDASGPPYQIALCPPDMLPKGKGKQHASENHRVWWDEPEVLDLVPELLTVRGVKRPIMFHVDDNGIRV